MGSEVIAKCKCGLEARILIGGGMVDFDSTSYFPYLCENCHSVVQVNFRAKRKQCPKCKKSKVIPYNDSNLIGRRGKKTLAEWKIEETLGRDLALTDGYYKCPQCGQMTLRFYDSGLNWD